MFWSITAMLTFEWLVAIACRFTLHGAIHGLLVLAVLSLLLALTTHVQGDARTRRRPRRPGSGYGLVAGAEAVRNSTYSASA